MHPYFRLRSGTLKAGSYKNKSKIQISLKNSEVSVFFVQKNAKKIIKRDKINEYPKIVHLF